MEEKLIDISKYLLEKYPTIDISLSKDVNFYHIILSINKKFWFIFSIGKDSMVFSNKKEKTISLLKISDIYKLKNILITFKKKEIQYDNLKKDLQIFCKKENNFFEDFSLGVTYVILNIPQNLYLFYDSDLNCDIEFTTFKKFNSKKELLNHIFGYSVGKKIPKLNFKVALKIKKVIKNESDKDKYLSSIDNIKNINEECILLNYFKNKKIEEIFIIDYEKMLIDTKHFANLKIDSEERMKFEIKLLSKEFSLKNIPQLTPNINLNVLKSDSYLNFEPILTKERLLIESEVMSHCVFTYRDKVNRGESLIYHVVENKNKSKYTLEIGYKENFSLQQIKKSPRISYEEYVKILNKNENTTFNKPKKIEIKQIRGFVNSQVQKEVINHIEKKILTL